MPAMEIFTGHFLPITRVSKGTIVLFLILNLMIQLSFPPEAYKYFPSFEKTRPNHPLAVITESRTTIFSGSIRWMLWSLCPLFVTANILPEGETAIFKGRSPTGSIFPTGDSFHPLGNDT